MGCTENSVTPGGSTRDLYDDLSEVCRAVYPSLRTALSGLARVR